MTTPMAMPMVSVKPEVSTNPYHNPTNSTEENTRLWETAYKEWVASTPYESKRPGQHPQYDHEYNRDWKAFVASEKGGRHDIELDLSENPDETREEY